MTSRKGEQIPGTRSSRQLNFIKLVFGATAPSGPGRPHTRSAKLTSHHSRQDSSGREILQVASDIRPQFSLRLDTHLTPRNLKRILFFFIIIIFLFLPPKVNVRSVTRNPASLSCMQQGAL